MIAQDLQDEEFDSLLSASSLQVERTHGHKPVINESAIKAKSTKSAYTAKRLPKGVFPSTANSLSTKGVTSPSAGSLYIIDKAFAIQAEAKQRKHSHLFRSTTIGDLSLTAEPTANQTIEIPTLPQHVISTIEAIDFNAENLTCNVSNATSIDSFQSAIDREESQTQTATSHIGANPDTIGDNTPAVQTVKSAYKDNNTDAKNISKMNHQAQQNNMPTTKATEMLQSGQELQHPDDWKSFMLTLQDNLTKSMTQSIESLKVELKADIVQVKLDKEAIKEDLVKIELEQVTMKTDLTKTKEQLNGCKVQISDLIGIVTRQDQIIKECKSQIEELKMSVSNANLIIQGIIVKKDQPYREAVNQFFQNQMKIQEDINIEFVTRKGKGKNAPLLVRLKDTSQKGVIFSHVKNLKDITNELDKPYCIDNDLPPATRERRRHIRQTVAINEKLDANAKLQIDVETKNDMKIEGTQYVKQVKPPSASQILLASKEKCLARKNVHFAQGNTVKVDGSEFTAYSVDVKDLTDVNNAYETIRARNLAARHVICAFRIPHRNFAVFQDYNDDDEHQAGRHVLQMLNHSKITSKAVFVVRYYDGTHIGAQRFDAIMRAVKSVFTKVLFNQITGENQYIWEGQPTKVPHRGDTQPYRGMHHQAST